MKKKKKLRSARGAGIIYGVMAVMAILMASVVGTVLVMNIGYCTIYNEKLAKVNAYAAEYAAAHAQDGSSDGAITAYTENLMLAMGLKPKNVSIEITHTNTDVGPSIAVTVTNQFSLFGSRGILPTQIALHNTAVAAVGQSD